MTTEVIKYQPNAPIGTAGTLKALMAGQTATLADLLPKHVTPARLIKTLMVAVNHTPKLLECTQSSVLESVTRSAELGLDLSGTLGEAYLVPFGNEAQLIIGYRGLAKLARQTGEVSRLDAEVVRENDEFTYQLGTKFKLKHKPCLTGDPGPVLGAYAICAFKDGTFQADFMTTAEIEKIRQISRGKNQGPWRDHWNEQAKKTVFRRLAKWLPMSGEKWEGALEQDNRDTDLSRPQTQATILPDIPADAPARQALPARADIVDPEPEAFTPRLRKTTDGREYGEIEPGVWVDANGEHHDPERHSWSATNGGQASYTKDGEFRAKRGYQQQLESAPAADPVPGDADPVMTAEPATDPTDPTEGAIPL